VGVDAIGVSVAEALGVWAAVIVALFWQPVLKRFRRPRLALRLTPERQSFHKTLAVSTVDPRDSFDCYYYRLEIENTGRTAARHVEVFARAAFRETSSGAWVKDERFLPQWLCWTTWRDIEHEQRVFMPVIPPRSARYFDLAHVIDPGGRDRLSAEDDPAAPKDRAILSLDVAIHYQRLGHLLPPGHYALLLEVSGANAEPKPFVVVVNNPGTWDADEEKMLSSGVKVEAIYPLRAWRGYGVVRHLLTGGQR